jgi:hypothetical protein
MFLVDLLKLTNPSHQLLNLFVALTQGYLHTTMLLPQRTVLQVQTAQQLLRV